jgi:hypothetical protein
MPTLSNLIAPIGYLDLEALGLSESDVEGYISVTASNPLLASASDDTQTAYVYWRAYSAALLKASLAPASESVGRYSVTYGSKQIAHLQRLVNEWQSKMLKLQPSLAALIGNNTKPVSVSVEVDSQL